MTRSTAFRRVGSTLLLAGTLAGCAGPASNIAGLHIDDSVRAVGQDARIRFIVLHYTAESAASSLNILSKQQVSAHYLISDDPRAPVYHLVDDSRRAWHAGYSAWGTRTDLNDTSIGIEIVNEGPRTGPDGQTHWQPYSADQIRKLGQLVKALSARYGIEPANIVGHSDVSPQRKRDPGPLFPWRELAQDGIGRWYDPSRAARSRARYDAQGVPDVAWFQERLAKVGYRIAQTGTFDEQTRNVLSAFQMHYRPAAFDGTPDAETASILDSIR